MTRKRERERERAKMEMKSCFNFTVVSLIGEDVFYASDRERE